VLLNYFVERLLLPAPDILQPAPPLPLQNPETTLCVPLNPLPLPLMTEAEMRSVGDLHEDRWPPTLFMVTNPFHSHQSCL